MAQNSSEKAVDKRVAELEQKLEQAQEPREKIELLMQICKVLSMREFVRCRRYAEHMLVLAEELQDSYWIARASYALAVYEYRATENSDVLARAERAAAIFSEIGEKQLEHQTLHFMGLVHRDKGNYPQALSLVQQSHTYWREVGDDLGISRSLYAIAAIYRRLGDYVKSLEVATEMFHIATEKQLLHEIQDAYGLFALVYSDMGNYEKAVYYNLKALETEEKEEKSDKSIIYRYKRNIGLNYYHLGQLDRAETYLLDAKEYYQTIGNDAKEAALWDNLGMVYEKRDNLTVALQYFRQAEALLERRASDNAYYLGFLYGNMANAYMRLGNTAVEIQCLEKALSAAIQTSDRKLQYELYFHISEAWNRAEDTEKAYSYHKLYASLKDEILNEERQKIVAEMQARFELERAESEKEIFRLKNVELVKAMEEISRLNRILAELNEEKNKLLRLVEGGLKTPLLGMRIAPE